MKVLILFVYYFYIAVKKSSSSTLLVYLVSDFKLDKLSTFRRSKCIDTYVAI